MLRKNHYGHYRGNKIQAFGDDGENQVMPKVEHEPLGLEISRPLVTSLSIMKVFSSL